MHPAHCLWLAILITPATGTAQTAPSWPTLSPPFYALRPGVSKIPEIDTERLRAAVDSFMDRDMADLRVPGAVVAIVQNGEVILLRGYGVADSARGTPVDPDHTVFRLGSVTKPFTAIAALQLAEQGRLDLHADVNRYLRAFQVPEAFGRPVTAHDLLTHTAGFDTRLNGTAARSEDRVRSLAGYLASDLPPRVRPPGDTLAYSNHGYTLLGHLVEAISGERYDAYVTDHILVPLGMSGASLRFTDAVARAVATGYEPRGYGHTPAPPVYPNIVPAASLNATGRDMTRFMIALLEGGEIDGRRILAESTVALMTAPEFRQDPRVSGMTYGFMENFWHGQRMVLHSGGIRGFMSAVYLWPDQHIGLFVADNGYRGDLIFDLLFDFMDRYFPYPDRLPIIQPGAAVRARRYPGYYRTTEQARDNLEKAGGIRNSPLQVEARADGTLRVFDDTFVEVAPGLFRNAGSETLAFLEDRDGNVRGVVTTYPFQGNEVMERIGVLKTDAPSQLLLVVTLVLSLFTMVAPPRWPRPAMGTLPTSSPSRASRLTTGAARLMAVLSVLFLALMWLGTRSASRTAGMLYGVPWQMDAAAIVAIGVLGLIPALLGGTVWTWRRSEWVFKDRLHLSLLMAVSVAFLLALWYWNLIGIQHR